MADFGPALPDHDVRRAHVLRSLGTIWPEFAHRVSDLPIEDRCSGRVRGPLRLVEVDLPVWAESFGVNGQLLVPAEAAGDQTWESADWWAAAFILLECWHERTWEHEHGPIHSYSFRLKDWDERAWERAWVNRIGLFLAAWAGVEPAGAPPQLRLSHDVDAIFKTVPIRIKQGALQAAIAMRRPLRERSSIGGALRLLCGRSDWWHIDEVVQLEHAKSLNVSFNVFADPRQRSPHRWLLDPGYRLDSQEGGRLIAALLGSGAEIGLHPSFDSWRHADLLAEQRQHLELYVGRPVRRVRQHWLRFSWEQTWAAQSTAGLAHDSTLMFNDRSGFRNAAALEWHPWNTLTGAPHELCATTSCFMDSHHYDYSRFAASSPLSVRNRVDECRAVGGLAEFLWHPHTLNADYGWRDGFTALLEELTT